MKICFLGDGNSIHIQRWLKFFYEKKHEVHLITFGDVEIDNIYVHKIKNNNIKQNGGNWVYIKNIRKIKKIIKKLNPDLVNAHYVTSYGFLGALSNFKPLVISTWGSDILVTPEINFIYKLITKYSLNRSDLITSDSYYMTDKIKNLSYKNVITVPMGVEENLCYKQRNDSNEIINIVSLRTINKNSNVDLIIKAFKEVVSLNKGRKLNLIIANSGPEIDEIKKLVNDLKIGNQVIIKGYVSTEDIINLLLSCNLYVTIPTSDSTSVSLLEAMACGALCLVSNIPANLEWINNTNGYIVDKFELTEIVNKMDKAINNSEFKNKCMNNNRELILKKALWYKNMTYVEEQYFSLTKHNSIID